MILLQELERLASEEAARAEMPIDRAVYEQAGRDPLSPTLCAGNPQAWICSFGRDPGRDEVRWLQPQVGAAGQLVRRGVAEAFGMEIAPDDRRRDVVLDHLFLANTVPYKPLGNKAYPARVKERFRPITARLLLEFWQGGVVLTLGTEAFQWFAPYGEGAALFWKREDRYEADWTCTLRADAPDGPLERKITVCPLPHPSPLNQRWVALFPDLLTKRLAAHGARCLGAVADIR